MTKIDDYRILNGVWLCACLMVIGCWCFIGTRHFPHIEKRASARSWPWAVSSTFAIYAIHINAILSSDQLDFLLDKSSERSPGGASSSDFIVSESLFKCAHRLVGIHNFCSFFPRSNCVKGKMFSVFYSFALLQLLHLCSPICGTTFRKYFHGIWFVCE